MFPTMEEVANLAGVSRSTVSRVINEQGNVREETRERVWKAIRQSGYQPNVVARSLVTSRTQIIGMIIPEAVAKLFTDAYFPLLLTGATEACRRHDHHLMVSLFTGVADRHGMDRRVLHSGYLDGAILASAPSGDPLTTDLLRDGIPFVSVGRHPDERVHCVDVDNVSGARMAVEHLLRSGRRRIATITGRLDLIAARDRLEGYRQALQAAGIAVDEDLIVEGDYSEGSGADGIRRLLPLSPDAVFAASDQMAVGALQALRQAGRRVPGDVALVGFDDIPLASLVEPPLTTMRQPIERMGSAAVELLLSLLESQPDDNGHGRRVIVSTELVVRGSCGAA